MKDPCKEARSVICTVLGILMILKRNAPDFDKIFVNEAKSGIIFFPEDFLGTISTTVEKFSNSEKYLIYVFYFMNNQDSPEIYNLTGHNNEGHGWKFFAR